MNEIHDNIKLYTSLVIEGEYTGLSIVGPGGLGKSFTVYRVVKDQLGDAAEYVRNSHATPLGLYTLLYEFREKPVLVLEDMDHIYRDKVLCGILRSALWGDEDENGKQKRMVTWVSSTAGDKAKKLPKMFEFKAGIVMIGNSIPKDSREFDAVLTRIPHIDLEVSDHEVFAFMRKMARGGQRVYRAKKGSADHVSEEACLELIDYLEQHNAPNLRLFKHGIRLVNRIREEGKAWEGALKVFLREKKWRDPTTPLEWVIELEGQKNLRRTDRERIFREKTGLRSRASYENYRKRAAQKESDKSGTSIARTRKAKGLNRKAPANENNGLRRT